MAAPATPSNLYVQQGNGQVALSWDISAGATSYPVLRSTDGVTFVEIAAPAVTQYLDESVTADTQYWYQVQAANSDGSSPVTSSQSIIPVEIGKESLASLRLQAQQRADMVGSQFVTVPEWNDFLNRASLELYDLLVTTYEDYSVAEPYEFASNAASSTGMVDLPNNMYKLLGVDLGLGNSWISLKRFNFIDRNKYAYLNQTGPMAGVLGCQYRVMGNKLMLTPVPAPGQQMRLWYVPKLPKMLLDTDTLDAISGWSEYVVVRAAKYALDKEESDTSKLDAELLFLKARIEESAANRDAGQPMTISDIRRAGFNDPIGDF